MTLCTTLVARTLLDGSALFLVPNRLGQPAKVSTLPIKHRNSPSSGTVRSSHIEPAVLGEREPLVAMEERAVAHEDAEQEQRSRTCPPGKSLPGQAAWTSDGEVGISRLEKQGGPGSSRSKRRQKARAGNAQNAEPGKARDLRDRRAREHTSSRSHATADLHPSPCTSASRFSGTADPLDQWPESWGA